jgi:hypothetical protein
VNTNAAIHANLECFIEESSCEIWVGVGISGKTASGQSREDKFQIIYIPFPVFQPDSAVIKELFKKNPNNMKQCRCD